MPRILAWRNKADAPFIATLAMLAIARGLTYLYTQGTPIRVRSSGFTVFGQGLATIVPVPVILMFVIFFICLVVLTQTRFGRYVYAIRMQATMNPARTILFVSPTFGVGVRRR